MRVRHILPARRAVALGACLLLVVGAHSEVVAATPKQPKPRPKAPATPFPDDLPDVLRAIAKRVEADLSAKNPSARGLAACVDELLKRKTPAKLQGFLQFVQFPGSSAQLMPGTHSRKGLVFNNSPAAVIAEIDELEQRLPTEKDPLPLRHRMATLTFGAEDEIGRERSQDIETAAVSLARQRVADAPGDAMAHAWLADCLLADAGTGRESHAAARRALELDPNCWRAMIVMAEEEGSCALFELQRGGAPPLGGPDPESGAFLLAVYDDPPDDARIAASEKRLTAQQDWLDRACAAAPNDPEPKLRRLGVMIAPQLSRQLTRLLRTNRPPTAEAFQRAAANMEASFFAHDSRHVRGILETVNLRPDDPHFLATVALLQLLPALVEIAGGGTSRTLKDDDRAIIEATFARLDALSNSGDPSIAARAFEAHAVMQAVTSLQIGLAAQLPQTCLRSLALDYRRHSAWELLIASLADAGRFPECNAATEIRVACWPYPHWHKQSATTAKYLHDWDRCEQHLLALQKARPDDISAKIGLAAVHLCQAAEKGAPEKVQDEFDALRDLYGARTASFTKEDKEDFVTNLIAFLCLRHGFVAAEEVIQACVADGRLPADVADKLRAEMQK